MKSERLAIFLFLAATAATVTWFAIEFNGDGLIRKNATQMALTAGIFVFVCAWLKIPAPSDRDSVRRAVMTPTTRTLSTLALVGLTGWGVSQSVRQATRGYPPLQANTVIGQPAELHAEFYTIIGTPILDSTYRMSGSEGQHVLVPIDRYEGRVLAMLDDLPTQPTELKITGLLRTDVRSVQRSQKGQIDGPFLGLYRERMGLPAGTRIYFLDTSKRAGLTLGSILWILIPLYFGLLILSQPVRRRPAS
ncbi:MAG: hypothetical protein CMH52_05505 [Myxococcales bacterium]|nr:hypothetical protein [Myxococcales bacterium]